MCPGCQMDRFSGWLQSDVLCSAKVTVASTLSLVGVGAVPMWARLGRRLPTACLRMAVGGSGDQTVQTGGCSCGVGLQSRMDFQNRGPSEPPESVALGKLHQTRSNRRSLLRSLDKPTNRLEQDAGEWRQKWRRGASKRRTRVSVPSRFSVPCLRLSLGSTVLPF